MDKPGTMKLLISGVSYDLTAGLAKADLYTLFELKSKYGIGMKSILATEAKFRDLADPIELLEDVDAFRVFLAIVWLARRANGEKLTLEEANSIPLDDFKFELDEDEAAAEDPKAQTGSAPAGNRAARRASTSRTSKRVSTKTS